MTGSHDGCCNVLSVAPPPPPNPCRSFVNENEGLYSRQVYAVLETVAVLDSPTVQALIPGLSLGLRTAEHKRGLGKNAALR